MVFVNFLSGLCVGFLLIFWINVSYMIMNFFGFKIWFNVVSFFLYWIISVFYLLMFGLLLC